MHPINTYERLWISYECIQSHNDEWRWKLHEVIEEGLCTHAPINEIMVILVVEKLSVLQQKHWAVINWFSTIQLTIPPPLIGDRCRCKEKYVLSIGIVFKLLLKGAKIASLLDCRILRGSLIWNKMSTPRSLTARPWKPWSRFRPNPFLPTLGGG